MRELYKTLKFSNIHYINTIKYNNGLKAIFKEFFK